MLFELKLELHLGLTWPDYSFNSDSQLIDTVQISDTVKLCTHIVSLPTVLTYTKNSNQTIISNGKIIRDQKILLQQFYFDEILLDPALIQNNSYYIPKYNQSFLDYCEKNSMPVESGQLNKLEFYNSGDWYFNPPIDFWKWYASIRYDNDVKYMSQSEIDLYIGTGKEHKDLLDQLEKMLREYV